MHKELDLSIDQLSKIEGHATLDVKVRNGKVETVRLQITENKRFYTQAIKGKAFNAAPQLMSRICGTCSIAHLICCIRAVENAMDVKVSQQVEMLRLLSIYGMYIRDHALHLYIFSLPDVLGKDSLLELDESKPEERRWIEEAFAVKAAGNKLSQLIAGRAVHAPFPAVGTHLKFPSREESDAIISELKKIRPFLFHVMDAFRDCPFDYSRQTEFVSILSQDFLSSGDDIMTSENERFSHREYFNYLEKVVIPYSQSIAYSFQGKEYMLGALARVNLNSVQLHKGTKKDASQYLKLFPSNNIFRNNLAQAIEIMHAIDHSIQILEETHFIPEPRPQIVPKAGEGIAAVEAPRGILYYKVKTNSEGIIEDGTVVVPTQQNQRKMESDVKDFIGKNLDKGKKELQFEIEKLIRAYDPCMSCASHFLRINWV